MKKRDYLRGRSTAPPSEKERGRRELARAIAAKIPDDADLGDEADVCRALYAEGFSFADIEDVLEQAIELARVSRATERAGLCVGLFLAGGAMWFWMIVALSPAHAAERAIVVPSDGHPMLAVIMATVVGAVAIGLSAYAMFATLRGKR